MKFNPQRRLSPHQVIKEQISSEGASLDSNEDSSHAEDLPSGPQDVTCSNVGAQLPQTPVNNYDNEIVSSNPQYTAVVDTVDGWILLCLVLYLAQIHLQRTKSLL